MNGSGTAERKPQGPGAMPGQRRVTFRLKAEAGKDVRLAGSFNDWDPKGHRMKYRNGEYRAALLLSPGRYEYKFVIDGIWCVDPACPDWAANVYGTLNSVVAVT